MIKKFILLTALVFLMCGCITFTQTDITTTIPRDIKIRNNFFPTAEWKYELAELAGSILVERKEPVDGQKYYLSKRIIKPGTEPTIEAIPDGLLIEIIVDDSADTKLKTISIGNIALGAKKKMAFTYSDASRVFIKYQDLDITAIIAEANKEPGPNTENRWFIQGALLSLIQRKIYNEAKGGISTNLIGSAFKAEGNIYHKASKTTKDYAIHLTLRDLDEFIEADQEELTELLKSTEELIISTEGLWITSDLEFLE